MIDPSMRHRYIIAENEKKMQQIESTNKEYYKDPRWKGFKELIAISLRRIEDIERMKKNGVKF